MKQEPNRFYTKALFRTTLAIALISLQVVVFANDGKIAADVTAKGHAPVNYYQAFMIGVAVTYGICLLVRARRRKRNSKITE